MRSGNLKRLAAKESDEIAGDAFDRQPDGVQQWITDAIRGEYAADDADAALAVIDAAVNLYHRPTDAERVVRLRRCVAHLRERYIDHASQAGTYAAEALDAVCAKAEEHDDAQTELRADIRAQEAADAALRG